MQPSPSRVTYLKAFPGKSIAIASNNIHENQRIMFDSCMIQWRFPKLWKIAALALIIMLRKHYIETHSSFGHLSF